jgi:hypothetical protein
VSARRQLAIAAAVLALFAIVDFASRVRVGRDAALRAFESPTLVPLPEDRGAARIRAQLASWLPEVAGGTPGAPDDPGAWQLRLGGTFQQRGRPFAVIMASTRGASGAPQTHRVGVGETVAGRTVREIRPGAVVLDGPAGAEELRLFARAERARP